MLTAVVAGCAQAESESISKNVRWGIEKRMKEGSYGGSSLYGYEKGPDDQPKIKPQEAEIVRLIYRRFLAGDSLRMIRDMLTEAEVPFLPDSRWSVPNIRGILGNEKYCGDVLMQKSFIVDCISKKAMKNTGQLPMYLIENNHEGIVSREIFKAAQAELARRNALQSPSKKYAPTGKGSYASKYALSERLVCGECGTMYRRCVWSRNGKSRVVWRCVSRLDYGKKYCHNSPTMDEEPLQQAILAAINSVMSDKEELSRQITDAMEQEIITLPDSDMTLGAIKRRLQELESEFDSLLSQIADGSLEMNNERFAQISEEMSQLKDQQEKIADQLRNNSSALQRLQNATTALDRATHYITEWKEETIRQLIHTVKVISADRIIVYMNDGAEIEQEVRKQ